MYATFRELRTGIATAKEDNNNFWKGVFYENEKSTVCMCPINS